MAAEISCFETNTTLAGGGSNWHARDLRDLIRGEVVDKTRKGLVLLAINYMLIFWGVGLPSQGEKVAEIGTCSPTWSFVRIWFYPIGSLRIYSGHQLASGQNPKLRSCNLKLINGIHDILIININLY